MKVKIDTKEKFHVISPEEPVLSANMTEELEQKLLSFTENEIKNVILKLSMVEQIDQKIAASCLRPERLDRLFRS